MGMLSNPERSFASWDEVGDSVVGTIAEFFMAEGTKFDSNQALAVSIEKDDGETVAIAFRIKDLREKFRKVVGDPDTLADLDPFIGDRVAVEFTAREKLPNGNVAKLFEVSHKPKEEAAQTKPKSLL
jgi:hypothetical protein